jgi:hypothetical protein
MPNPRKEEEQRETVISISAPIHSGNMRAMALTVKSTAPKS